MLWTEWINLVNMATGEGERDEWEVSSNRAKSFGPGLVGIMEVGCQALCGGRREQERGPRAF